MFAERLKNLKPLKNYLEIKPKFHGVILVLYFSHDQRRETELQGGNSELNQSQLL